jgi:hypothetical protein
MKRRAAREEMIEMAKQLMAEIVSVPASESETGRDEVYVVFDGKRIAKRTGTAYAGTWVSIEPGFEVLVDGGDLMVLQNTDPPSIH